jgi:hypothetical protein
MQPELSADDEARARSVGRLVVKNTLYLTMAQVVTIPLSVAVAAVMGRYLGAEEFGLIYFAGTLAGFGFLAVEWGHSGALPALVATDRSQAGVLLGTSLAWRAATALIVHGVLALACRLLGHGANFQWALGLTCLWSLLTSFVAACKDTIRGFERTDIPAYGHVAHQLLTAALVIPVVMLGGRMRAALAAMAVAIAIALVPMLLIARSVGVGELSVNRPTSKSLFMRGRPCILALPWRWFPVSTRCLSKLAPGRCWAGTPHRVDDRCSPVAASASLALFTRLSADCTRRTSALRSRFARRSALGDTHCCPWRSVARSPRSGITIFSRKSYGPRSKP